jgi:hypothetical protein
MSTGLEGVEDQQYADTDEHRYSISSTMGIRRGMSRGTNHSSRRPPETHDAISEPSQEAR